LKVQPDEFKLLFDTTLINLTAFFRDPPAWDYLDKEIVPRMIQCSECNSGNIRVWSAGCASGEGAYSSAVMFGEAMGAEELVRWMRIYAIDVDDDALQKARHATYTPRELEGVPPELRDKYFSTSDSKRMFRSDLRLAIIFGRHDLIQNAPISRLDLLICRNTLMYFSAEIQSQVLARMHFALRDTSFLFLGKAEMLITQARLFTPVSLDYRTFGKLPRSNLQERFFTLR
jgi:two-component system CheB/CheR fusion protein